jgi:hypothetical protein
VGELKVVRDQKVDFSDRGNIQELLLPTKLLLANWKKTRLKGLPVISREPYTSFLHFVRQLMISIVYGSPAAGSGNKRAAVIGGLGR